MKTLILLIEDDCQQSETIKRAIERRYQSVSVELIESESDFCQRLHSLPDSKRKPRVVICDVMLPWASPAPDAPTQPREVAEGTFRKAGLRCWARFREHQDLRSVPWIYFTVLDEKTIDLKSYSDDKTGYVQKAGSIEPLFAEIDEFQDNAWPDTDEDVSSKLMASPNMLKLLLTGLNTTLDDCLVGLP